MESDKVDKMHTQEGIAPRVSIAERLVPALAYAVAAIAGIVGAWRMIAMFEALRRNENAGFSALFGGLSEIEGIVGAILAFAAVLGIAGMAVPAVRMFMTTRTASPSPWLIAAMGIVGLIAPMLVAGCIGALVSALKNPAQTGLVEIGATIGTLQIVTIIAGMAALPVLLVLSVVPFRGTVPETTAPLHLSTEKEADAASPAVPKRPATLIVIILVDAAIATLTAWYFVEMFALRHEIMLH